MRDRMDKVLNNLEGRSGLGVAEICDAQINKDKVSMRSWRVFQ